MSTASQQLAAIEAAVREVCENEFLVHIDYLDFDDAKAVHRVERDGADVLVSLDVALTRVEGDVMTLREGHRFPLALDPEAIGRNIEVRLEEIHDAAQRSEGLDLPGDVKRHRLDRIAARAIRGDAGAIVEFMALERAGAEGCAEGCAE